MVKYLFTLKGEPQCYWEFNDEEPKVGELLHEMMKGKVLVERFIGDGREIIHLRGDKDEILFRLHVNTGRYDDEHDAFFDYLTSRLEKTPFSWVDVWFVMDY